jgi:hypothetical protein
MDADGPIFAPCDVAEMAHEVGIVRGGQAQGLGPE